MHGYQLFTIMNHVPFFLISGHTSQEADINLEPREALLWSWQNYRNYLVDADLVSHNIETIYDFYPNKISPAYQITSMVSDIRVICPGTQLANVARDYLLVPVYRYIVMTRPSKPIIFTDTLDTIKASVDDDILENTLHYAFHGWDLMSFFGTIPDYIDDPSNGDTVFQQRIRSAIFDFVTSHSISDWPVFSSESTVIIDDSITFKHRYKGDECQFWKNNQLWPRYQWIH